MNGRFDCMNGKNNSKKPVFKNHKSLMCNKNHPYAHRLTWSNNID